MTSSILDRWARLKFKMDFAGKLRSHQVRFGNPVCRTVNIKNTGKVVCKFKFIQKLNEATAFKPWIHINPVEAIMVQGTIVAITLTILVQKMTALELNLGRQNLSDILILSLENGNSFYVSFYFNVWIWFFQFWKLKKNKMSFFDFSVDNQGRVASKLFRIIIDTFNPVPRTSQKLATAASRLWKLSQHTKGALENCRLSL